MVVATRSLTRIKRLAIKILHLCKSEKIKETLQHILDNPIWHALNTGNRKLANGDDRAKLLKPEVGAFAGLKENSIGDLMSLQKKAPLESPVVLFAPGEISIPGEWQIIVKKPLLQMVYLHKDPPPEKVEVGELTERNIDAMLSLTALTEPGPFLRRTIDFGNYQGIFEGEQLVAMAGQRLQPGNYIEISAVCTHPAHLGKGYAGMLVRNQIRHILGKSSVPFLHVLPENHAAYRLYLKLGFEVRKEMLCYVLKKADGA